MIEPPQFFLPDSNPEMWESDYAKLATRIATVATVTGVPKKRVLDLAERIYSITFVQDGEEWTATVGETLHGFRLALTDRRRTATRRLNPLSDPAKVLAIFPGEPYAVVTNVSAQWESPFYVSEHAIRDLVHFTTP